MTIPPRPGAPRRVFVYGTLLAGEVNHHVLGSARRVGDARTEPGFELRDLGTYPGLCRGGDGTVIGELYEVDPATLARLDRFEGHPELYRRELIRISGGEEVEAYVAQPRHTGGRPVIAGGSWRGRPR